RERMPVLDAQGFKYLKEALADGSISPGDQAEITDIMMNGWGKNYFNRNAAMVYSLVKEQGNDYRWLALVLQGENEINEAWRARGVGYAGEVSDTGWQGFSKHLATARSCVTEPWQ